MLKIRYDHQSWILDAPGASPTTTLTRALQVQALKDNLATANQIISSCPACKENFYNLFCTFTCSPDQSLFVNVTKSIVKDDKLLVAELDQLVPEEYGSGFYDSCKEVKFGPTNSKAMTLIGGGAKNYTGFLEFLGKKRFGGSPFQMNFPRDYAEPGMAPQTKGPKKCNDEDPNFRCACIDCPEVCPKPPELEQAGSCQVGPLPCLSFAAVLIYGLLLLGGLGAVSGRFAWKRYGRQSEGHQLLHDPRALDDDEDDDDEMLPNGHGKSELQNYKVNAWCNAAFRKLGHLAARFPGITIGSTTVLVIILSAGLARFQVETDPARLWVSPTSAAAQEKAFFDSAFGPFYRAEKVFLVNDIGSPGPVLSYDTLSWWMGVEHSIRELKGPAYGRGLEDICFKPTGDSCVVQSVSAYFGNDPDQLGPATWKEKLTECANNPAIDECRPSYGQPLDPELILGGYGDLDHVADAPAMTVTWVVNNWDEDSDELRHAADWEGALIALLLDVQEKAKDRGLRLSFSTESSLEQELNKSTNTDAKIIVISYIIMLLYASIALGATTIGLRDLVEHFGVALVESKFSLGLAGIAIVLLSITSSVGLFSWAGLKATLIIVDVIPFIVLAVGVDNIFLIVHEFERVNVSHPDEQVEERVARALGRMGPSILFSAITETISFALGAFVGMPAVRNFAIYAAGAVFINAILQVTMFISVLTLNQHRVEAHRADLLCCFPVKSARIHLSGSGSMGSMFYEFSRESTLQRFIRQTYAPAVLGKKAKLLVVAVFAGLFAAGVALLPKVELGLDQRVAIPDDSYLIPYFNDLYDYFDSGPPVYFVAKESNSTQRRHQKEMCSRFTTCDQKSLTSILEMERKRSNTSYIATPTASWIDDFLLWLNPAFGDSCCAEKGKACFANHNPPWSPNMEGMPEGDEFVYYLKKFLASPTTAECPLGGQASYGQAVVVDGKRDTIPASHFRTMHTPLRSQEDFIAAYASARRIASDITESTGVDVFPYSVFYIFFDQYASIIRLTATLLCAAVAIIFAVACVLLGSPATAAVVAGTVVMTIVDIMGAMAVMGVSLNAVSLVNLIICVGIAVEFCAHIARAYTFPARLVQDLVKTKFPRGRDQRAWTALVNVGGSVFSGITLTKIVGVSVLAFTRSKIFEIYYFRIWVALVVFAASHALVFLPVALSLVGGGSYVDPESYGGLPADLMARQEEEDSSDDEI